MAARRLGFKQLDMLATLTGEPLYRKCGFASAETLGAMLPDGVSIQGIKMEKRL